MDGADGLGRCLSDPSLEHLELCIKKCQCAMDDTVSLMEAHRSSSCPTESRRVAECVSCLESSEATLLATLKKHSAVIGDHGFSSSCYAVCTVAAGYAMMARVQLTKRQLIHTENASMFAQARDTEASCVRHATELQREALSLAQGENDVSLETSQALSHVGMRDAQCMSLALSRGFSASSLDTLIGYAASAFALVLKLFAAKCHVVEELIVTAASLLCDVPIAIDAHCRDEGMYRERTMNVVEEEIDEKASKEGLPAKNWFTSMLSCVHPKVLPGQAIKFHIALHCDHNDAHPGDDNVDPPQATERDVVEVDVVPPAIIAVIFASLLWNTALCLWRGGDIVAAYQWLCACDVSQLLRAAEDSQTDREAEEETTKESSDHTKNERNDEPVSQEENAKNVAIGNCENSVNTCNEEDEDDAFSLLNWQRLLSGIADYHITEEMSSKRRLHRLARYIMSLRDICALVLNCITPRDVLYVINEMHHAVQEQQEHVPSADIRAEILTVVMHIVELYLSRRAVRHMRYEALTSSVPSSSTAAEETRTAVRHVCDELVRYLTCERYWGVDEVERDGLPILWDTCHGDGTAGPDAASRWLQVQVIGMTLAFAADYKKSTPFAVAMRDGTEHGAPLFPRGDSKDDEDTWTFWSTAVARKVQHFVWGSGAPVSSPALPFLRHALLPLRESGSCRPLPRGEGAGRGVLRLPSLMGAGLPLLAEESVDLLCAVPPPLGLLVAVYHTARAAAGPAPLPHARMMCVSMGLDRAAAEMAEELCRSGNSAWRETWQRARAQNAARAATAVLCAAPRLTVPQSSTNSPVYSNSSEKADSMSAAFPSYDPPVTFDFSVFTAHTAEAIREAQRLVPSPEMADSVTSANAKDTCVLSQAARRLLHDELPALWQFMPWRVVYSTRLHGISYANLLACSERATGRRGGPMILVIVPREHSRLIFGAFLSHAPVLGSQRFYGAGDTFLFQVLMPPEDSEQMPQLRAFHSTGANAQYINCRRHSLAVGGGGEGGCGIFVDSALRHVSTGACATFGSPPLTQWNAQGHGAQSMENVDIAAVELLALGEAKE